MSHFKKKVTLVTGGASGIGRALGQELAKAGATVILADIQLENGKEAAQEINQHHAKSGGHATYITLDVTDADAVQSCIDTIVQEHGRIDFVFNNAGIVLSKQAKDLTLEEWKRVMDVNVNGVIYGVQAAYQQMCRQGFGHIVNTASMAGLMPTPFMLPYATSKYAVLGLSTSLRIEGRKEGVKVSAVCPGFIRTPLVKYIGMKELPQSKVDRVMQKLPMVTPERCAQLILKGVRKNKAIITMPTSWHALWFFSRIFMFIPHMIGSSTISLIKKQMVREQQSSTESKN